MPQTIIELHELSKQYAAESFSGVKNISFSIAAGQITAIVGESGSGKSTLLKLIYGLLSPDTGKVLFKGEPIAGPEEKLIPGHDRMKMVTQDFNLNTYAKVYDNIAAMLSNTDLQAKKEKTMAMMDLLKISRLSGKRVVELSGGEQQRVAIARAIITEPEVLLMDEPFSQVDTLLKNQLRDDLKHLARDLGISIILVSHDPADGLSLADEMVILRRGELLEKGAPEKIYNEPGYLYTARLLAGSAVIMAEDARKLGLKASRQQVALYPEWVKLSDGWGSRPFTVIDCYFKGFYEELLVERNGVRIRALNIKQRQYRRGDTVYIVLGKFVEFDQQ